MFRKVTLFLLWGIIFAVVSRGSLARVNTTTVDPGIQKAHFITEVLTKNPHLAEQIWNIGFTAFMTGFGTGNSVNKDAKEKILNYILDNIPSVMKNKNFQNFVHDVTNEIVMAYNKSDVFRTTADNTNMSSHSSASGVFRIGKTADNKDLSTHSTARDIIKHVDFYKVLKSIIENGKLLFDTVRGKDSTVLISILNSIIDFAPIVWHDSSFQHTKDIVIKELTLGYQCFLQEQNTSSNAINNTNIIIDVIKHTNIGRMLTESLMAEKPIFDKILGKESTYLLLGIGLLAKIYPTLISDKRFNSIKVLMVKHLEKTFLKLNYTPADLQQNASNIIKEVIVNTNKLKLLKDIMQTSSARGVFPFPSDSKISNMCYSDTMDFLDSVSKMSPWAITMFDSFGKLSEGVLSGHLNMVGSYDQCIDVKANITSGTTIGNRTTEQSRSFGARYCRLSVKIQEGFFKLDTKGLIFVASWGICIPDSCHSTDIKEIFHLSMKAVKGAAPFLQTASVYCSEEESISDDPSAVAAIVILSLFCCLTLLGTFVQLVLSERANQRKSSNSDEPIKSQELTKSTKVHSTILCNAYCDKDSKISGISIIEDNMHSKVEEPKPKESIMMEVPNQLPDGSLHHSEDCVQTACNEVEQSVQKGNVQTKTNLKADEIIMNNRNDGVLVRLITSFAVHVNGKKLMYGNSGENEIKCIHGIRFFSVCWILLSHSYYYGIISVPDIWATDNIINAAHWIERLSFQAALSTPFAVDTFYMISGMLVIYLHLKPIRILLKTFECVKVTKYVCTFIFHRFWRLTPLYMIIVMIFGCLMKYFGDGPFWPSSIPTADVCKSNWWTNFLYISNFLPHDEQCMEWSWFMSSDMQFYLVALIFLVILSKSIPIGVVSVVMLLLGGASSAAYAEHVYKGDLLNINADKYAYWDHVYIPPWCRVSAYCVGMLLGVIFVNRPRKKLNLVVATIGWVLATSMSLFLVYIPYTDHQINGKWALDIRTVYESIGRPLWATCVAWVIFACYNGNGGIANSFLSWQGLVPFSRLSYGAYLINPIVIMTYVLSRRSLFYLSDYNMVYLYIGNFVMTFMASFVASLVFEAPLIDVEKIITRR